MGHPFILTGPTSVCKAEFSPRRYPSLSGAIWTPIETTMDPTGTGLISVPGGTTKTELAGRDVFYWVLYFAKLASYDTGARSYRVSH
jgi:hypothetical protein